MRSCSEISLNDCQKVNNEIVCICSGMNCNSQHVLELQRKFGKVSYESDDEEESNESGDRGNFYQTTTAETTEDYDLSFNNFAYDTTDNAYKAITVTVSVSTVQPATINDAVNFNLSNICLILCAFFSSFFLLI
jgi:hypothetical protein